MSYTPNVPQANQQISTTQVPILNNFTFLDNAIGQEHNFDVTNAANTYHLQASMPNQALSPALGVTNGVYFVSSGKAYFYDGTNNWIMSNWKAVLTGTFTPASSSSFANIAAIPANVTGIIYFYGTGFAFTGSFYTDGSNCYGYTSIMKKQGSGSSYPVELNNTNAALFLQGRNGTESTGNTYNYAIFYR